MSHHPLTSFRSIYQWFKNHYIYFSGVDVDGQLNDSFHHHHGRHPSSSSSKNSYEQFYSLIGLLPGFLSGYISTLSGIMLLDKAFLDSIALAATEEYDYESIKAYFVVKFIVLFYFGEICGALVSYLLSDNFGRKSTLYYVSILGFLLILWTSFVVNSIDDMLTSRFFIGCLMGLLMAVSPVYTAEVSKQLL